MRTVDAFLFIQVSNSRGIVLGIFKSGPCKFSCGSI